jgi:hypothetical protein
MASVGVRWRPQRPAPMGLRDWDNGLAAGTVAPRQNFSPGWAMAINRRRGCALVRRLVASVAQFDAAVRKLLL